MLPADTPHCLLLQWRERKQLPTHSAERVMVIIEDPLVTVFVADVSGSSQFAMVHVPKYVLILAPFVTLVTRVWPFCVKNGGQENHIAGLSNHRFAKYLHWTAAKNLFTDPFSFWGRKFLQPKTKIGSEFCFGAIANDQIVLFLDATAEPIHLGNMRKKLWHYALGIVLSGEQNNQQWHNLVLNNKLEQNADSRHFHPILCHKSVKVFTQVPEPDTNNMTWSTEFNRILAKSVRVSCHQTESELRAVQLALNRWANIKFAN